MTRFRILLGIAVVAAGLSMPAAANASAPVSKPSRPVATAQTGARPVTQAECFAVRRYMHRPNASCAHIWTIYVPATGTAGSIHSTAPAGRLMASSDAGRQYYWTGWEIYCDDYLCSGQWGAEQDFNVTFIHGVGVWNNWHSCTSGFNFGTTVTWCGLWHNGWSNYMQEGENFTQGYMRAQIDTYGNYTWIAGATTRAYLRICLGEVGVC